ncbi:MAG: neutral trehalase, partial [Akkermansia sp.]
SALGPISLFIENILGFHKIDALSKEVFWRLHKHQGKQGIKNLRFGTIVTDIVFDGTQTINVKSNTPYSLIINKKKYSINQGENKITL